MNKKEVADNCYKGIRNCKRIMTALHDHCKRLEEKASEQWSVGNNEQWEAYMASIEHTQKRILQRFDMLNEFKKKICTITGLEI